jgi:hypothetical protein
MILLGMVALSAVLWVGIPLGWLWVGSQVEGATGNLGAGLAAAFVGSLASIAVAASALAGLNDRYRARRVARGRDDTGRLALDIILVCSCVAALVGYGVWLLFFSEGTSPIPINPSS